MTMIKKPGAITKAKVVSKLPTNVGAIDAGDLNPHQQMVANLLEIPAHAHREHLNTRSYSRHMALDELYSDLPGIMDNYAEIVVRAFGEIPSRSTIQGYHDMSIDEHLGLVYEEINQLYSTIPSGSPCLEDSLGSIQSFLSGIRYKLERLTEK